MATRCDALGSRAAHRPPLEEACKCGAARNTAPRSAAQCFVSSMYISYLDEKAISDGIILVDNNESEKQCERRCSGK